MCLAVLALGQSKRFPLVIAANRDEFTERPALPLHWWRPPAAAEPILAGQDARAGGAWMGLNRSGRFALLTNVRRPGAVAPDAPTRGQIVSAWLQTSQMGSEFVSALQAQPYAPFNLIAADLPRGEFFWAQQIDGEQHLQAIGPGLWGLSNAALDTPWPKVQRLKAQAKLALKAAEAAKLTEDASSSLASALLAALADDRLAETAELPQTGVPLEIERMLSAIFIRSADGHYGTRCSTLLICERLGAGHACHTLMLEASAGGGVVQERLADWPPLPWPAAFGG